MFLEKYKIAASLLYIVIFSTIGVNLVYSRIFNISIVNSQNIEPYSIALEGVFAVLHEKGYEEKTNLNIGYYDLERSLEENFDVVGELKNKKPDLIITLGTDATRKIKKEINFIPVVFSMVLNPVESGLVKSIQCSGNNLTGASLDVSPKMQFEVLKEILPQVKKIGVIYDPHKTGDMIERSIQPARELNLNLIKIAVTSPKEVPNAIGNLIEEMDVLWIIADSTVVSKYSLEYMLMAALKAKIPVMGYTSHMVRLGAIFCLNCDYEDIGRQAGELSCEILKGVEPNSLPVTLPRKTHLILNLKVAERLGEEIPLSLLEKSYKIFE